MRVPAMLLVLALAIAGPLASPSVAAEGAPDFAITLREGAPPQYEGPTGWFTSDGHEDGSRYAWTLDIPADYVVGDIRIPDGLFDVERPQQVVPMVNVSATHYPLFNKFPREDLWNADGPAQVYRYIDDGDQTILRLGFPGPLNGTFSLTRDTAPPAFQIGPIQELVHYGFYQESTTGELARADLRVRPVDGGLERENPTPMFAYLQKFPVQGLDPETEHEAWIEYEDWAGNQARSASYTVTTPPRPTTRPPSITVLGPAPNATGVAPDTAIQIEIQSEAPESMDGFRMFVDVRPVSTTWDAEEGIMTHRPERPLQDGAHRVLVEVEDRYGNVHVEQWSFTVGTSAAEAPGAAVSVLLGLVALVGVLARRHALR